MSSLVEITILNSVAIIELNRPDALNAIDQALAEAFLASIQSVTKAPNIRVLVVRGRGRGFCAGGDVATFQGEGAADRVDKLIRTVHTGLEILASLPQPSIAALHGAVAGVGLSLALACDFAIAEETTKLTTAYSRIGATLDGAMSWSLPRVVGLRKAKEMALLGDVINADEAYRIGILNKVVAPEELEEAVMTLATRLAEGPTQAYGRIKSLLHESFQNTMVEQFDMECRRFVQNVETHDFKIGVEAFLGKKKPHYNGF